MTEARLPNDLTGKMLIAMPAMGDQRFGGSLILICSHGADGAMGVIVNKPLRGIHLGGMLEQLEIPGSPDLEHEPVCYGGPVAQQRGFVLHGPEYGQGGEETLEIDGRFCMSATLQVLRDLAAGRGPSERLIALGYAGWAPGQLEAELQANGWLTCEASPTLVFEADMDGKWEAALATLGVHPSVLSAEGGRA